MSDQDLKAKVLDIISKHKTGVLASVEDNKPHARYMTFYNRELVLYTPTQKDTEKVEEIEKNPYVSVLLGYEQKGQTDAFIEMLGTASITDDQALKDEIWEESFNQWFEGPKDPNYILLEIQPEVVRVLNLSGEPPQELSMKNS
ncbi:pyridoxamine 5'-phosphate oxidase family protein [Neobacillus niacini]|uniref:pyridoxamine 5'-phosphate oxidase family protein n=1 Tax=Neobacillus niacini TaxID=86668 RepID=UPI0021CB43DC|nr:pyridoxamine 5'-phosphate oxidase family protein [Neobacillus niacini]MCM3768634.1 pyridoxamine 5'-phosphate oxidase family protein [Neobacillus niacini]